MNPVIVVAAYSREKSLLRLLSSIENAKYPSDNIKLIISMDGGASEKVLSVAIQFKFSKGKVEIVTREKNIGLRNHILWCGDLSLIHGSVIVLEDDLYLDPYFYYYAIASLEYYNNNENIAGIALYSQKYNEYAKLPFLPLFNGYSNYFMQVPCSWGEAWTAYQWSTFKTWYENANQNDIDNCLRLPDAVKSWPESSWKKYFSAYMVYKGKYFVYPYQSYDTNCSDDGGTHLKNGTDYFQVPLSSNRRVLDVYNFSPFESTSIKYDAFMEPINPIGLEAINIQTDDVEFDFYGMKPLPLLQEKKWCLTSKKCFDPEIKISLRYKPVEINLLQLGEEIGNGIISLCRPSNLIKENSVEEIHRYFKLSEYYCGIPLTSKKLLIGILLNLYNKLYRKLYR